MIVAITGGTGFVGGHLLGMAVEAGHEVRALTRRARPLMAGVTWVEGALDSPDSLSRLVAGADAVIHVAGVIKGDREAFRIGNIVGTEHIVEAAAHAGITRFVHISSLAAREPDLSAYGWSKAVSEEPVIAAGGDWTIIRPPAIYGPGDREMLELFRAARCGIVPVPRGTRLSVIAVEDLCSLILACLTNELSVARTYEPDDGQAGRLERRGVRTRDRRCGRTAGDRGAAAQGRLGRGIGHRRALRGARAKLTRDRVAYFCHPDWTASPHARPIEDLWQPEIATRAGLAATARWYRAEGWLP
jgi:uncharacterized protein YbjT (DUF2867 family)